MELCIWLPVIQVLSNPLWQNLAIALFVKKQEINLDETRYEFDFAIYRKACVRILEMRINHSIDRQTVEI